VDMEPDKSKGFVYRMAEFTWFLMGNVSDLPPYWDVLAVAEAIGDPAQGIITGSIFVVGFREVRETWKGWLCPWIAPSPTNCDAFDNADSEFPHFQRSELTVKGGSRIQSFLSYTFSLCLFFVPFSGVHLLHTPQLSLPHLTQ